MRDQPDVRGGTVNRLLGSVRYDMPERLKLSQDRPKRERRAKLPGQRSGRTSKSMTLLTVYNEVHLLSFG